MMAEATGNWIVVCDAVRMRIFEDCSHWDHMTFLGALSSDPRSWDELAIAWSRYHRRESWEQVAWRELQQLPRDISDEADCLFIDLAQQIYALPPEDESEIKAGPYCSRDYPDRPVWINIPPWWRRHLIQSGDIVPLHNERAGSDATNDASLPQRPVPTFRDVLFGGEFIEFVADRMLARGREISGNKPGPKIVQRSSRKRRRAISKAALQKRRRAVSAEEGFKVVRQVHADWLMTPRESLQGMTPRECLHWQREWKDTELDFRRAQWSRDKLPPPGVPLTSHLFQSGPMGIEEVVSYFEYCRELLTMALRWVIQEPAQSRASLIYALLNYQQQLFDGPASEGVSGTLRTSLKSDRQLMPQVASSEPLDCDCPLCRMQSSQSDLFGPAFSICDGFHLEMEDDFAFSLYADREEWELMRDPWLNEPAAGLEVDSTQSRSMEETQSMDSNGESSSKRERNRKRRAARRARQRARDETNHPLAGKTVLVSFGIDRSLRAALSSYDMGRIIDPPARSDRKIDAEVAELDATLDDSLDTTLDDSLDTSLDTSRDTTADQTLDAGLDELGGPPESVWRNSYVTPTTDPRLSLFSIGARLGELIELLKTKAAPRPLINRLNTSFDELGRGTSDWLIGNAIEEAAHSNSIESAVKSMIEGLEEVARIEPTLVGHSADLQSLVDQWQRQLLAR